MSPRTVLRNTWWRIRETVDKATAQAPPAVWTCFDGIDGLTIRPDHESTRIVVHCVTLVDPEQARAIARVLDEYADDPLGTWRELVEDEKDILSRVDGRSARKSLRLAWDPHDLLKETEKKEEG